MTTPDPDVTARVPDATARVRTDVPFAPRASAHGPQFAPGTIIAGRYRISSILGSGGMGEVYRADDTKLDQAVALKFLPARLARDPVLLTRLHDEVRLGRQIAHPNVCRTYDIVDSDNAHFVAMEYVDGEDLSRLLRRIGRLPHDKAVDITRGIAAGLMAAHGKGILHRDLKPANVMIDSHGDARIMDFGLALGAGEDDATIAGTPAYMAPEQLEGKPATVQSDLFALGLVMYELFTGKRPFHSSTVPELRREHSTSEISSPSDLVRDLDPIVERVMLRCLDHDPGRRPRSAREVIDALPGGDPLAAALAAGETPSPGMVAAAGTDGALQPAVAWTLLALSLLFLGITIWERRTHSLTARVGLTTPPEVHADRTATVVRTLGLPPLDSHSGAFSTNERYLAWIETSDPSATRWQRLKRGLPAVTYWSRRPERKSFFAPDFTPWRPNESGVHSVQVDLHGRLYALDASPDPKWAARPLDWRALLAAAGLERAQLTPATPAMFPASGFDSRMAWTGKHPEDGTPIRIDAAAWRGTPVYFRISGPWEDDPNLLDKVGFGGPVVFIGQVVFFVMILCSGVLLAWRNLRLRRGDRAGAFRLASVMFVASFATDLLDADHVAVFGHEAEVVWQALVNGLVFGGTIYILYIAIEPFIRRRWPEILIGWARLLSGKPRDPMVGRDLLIGTAAGLFHAAFAVASHVIVDILTGEPGKSIQTAGGLRTLTSFRFGLARVLGGLGIGVIQGMLMVGFVVLLTMIFRRRWVGIAGLAALYIAFFVAALGEPITVTMSLLIVAVLVIVVARYGLLGIVTAMFTFFVTLSYPAGVPTGWAAATAWLPVVVVTALTIYAFRVSLGSRSPFSAALIDD